jgi:coenzyme PQQ precursor peptide PqqA
MNPCAGTLLWLHRNITRNLLPRSRKNLLANFSTRSNLALGADTSGFTKRRATMAWKAPKIVEVPCGMEINMYVSATRK